jgi:hypothetical protein
MMTQHNKLGLQSVSGAIEKLITQFSGALFEINRLEPACSFDHQLDIEPTAQLTHESFIAVRFRSAETVVQVGRCNLKTEVAANTP